MAASITFSTPPNSMGSQIEGEIPSALGNLPKITNLDLSHNGFGGPIPAALGKLATVTWLDMSHNQLADQLPAEFSDLSSLR